MHHKPLNWDENCQWAFLACKTKIRDCLCIRSPKLRKKPFTLYIAERQEVALGVLTQKFRYLPRLIVYFSEQLDQLVTG